MAREIHTLRLCFVAVSHGVSLKCGEGASFVWRYTWALRQHKAHTRRTTRHSQRRMRPDENEFSRTHVVVFGLEGCVCVGSQEYTAACFFSVSRSKTTKGCLATKIMMMTRHEVLLGAVLFDQTARRKHMLHSLRKHTPISNTLRYRNHRVLIFQAMQWVCCFHLGSFTLLPSKKNGVTQTADAR